MLDEATLPLRTTGCLHAVRNGPYSAYSTYTPHSALQAKVFYGCVITLRTLHTALCRQMCFMAAWWALDAVLGQFAKLRKPTVGFVGSVRLHETTPLPTSLVSLNSSISVLFENLYRRFRLYWNLTGLTSTVPADQYTLLITSRWFLLRTTNVSHKSCRENQNTHFVFNNFFFENRAV